MIRWVSPWKVANFSKMYTKIQLKQTIVDKFQMYERFLKFQANLIENRGSLYDSLKRMSKSK